MDRDNCVELQVEVATLRSALACRQAEIGRLAMEDGRLQAALTAVGLDSEVIESLALHGLPQPGDDIRMAWVLNHLVSAHEILFDGAMVRILPGCFLKRPAQNRADIDKAMAIARLAEAASAAVDGDCATCGGTGTAFGKVCDCRSLPCPTTPIEEEAKPQEGKKR